MYIKNSLWTSGLLFAANTIKLVENQLSFVYTFKHFENVRLMFFEAKKKKNYTRSKLIKKKKMNTYQCEIYALLEG
jgi:hypothetical protein